jgi:hypothetical protein
MSIELAIIRVGTGRPDLIHTPLTAWQRVNQALASRASGS